jgi:hypothetical protein
METNFLNDEERDFVLTSLAKVEKQAFQAVLASGEQLLENSKHVRASFPEVHIQVLTEALKKAGPPTRCHAAFLAGEEAIQELFSELVRLVTTDPADEVRRAAASSLVRLNRVELFSDLIEKGGDGPSSSEVIGALSRIRVAADASATASVFEDLSHNLSAHLRFRIRLQSWLLRLKRGLPILVVVLIPAVLLSALSAAAFKSLPGALNFALCQAAPSAAMGVFHGLTAAVIWGGGIILGLVLYRVVFGRQRGAKSYLRPISAVVTGAIVGAITSAMVLLLISTVYTPDSLRMMGWLVESKEKTSAGLGHDLLWESRLAWPYLIMGTFLGIGMALMINGLRASGRWSQFLAQQTPLSGVREAWRLILALAKLAIRFAWPIPLALLIAGVLAFSVLRSAPASRPGSQPWTEALRGGLSRSPENLRKWKVGAWGQGLGIIGDGVTQAIGGFFAVVGMGLGIIIIRYGVRIEPQRN